MPTFLSEILAQLKAIWARLDPGQRFVSIAVVVGALIGVGALVWFAGRPELRTVTTSEDGRVLAKAISALEQSSIAYVRRGNELLVEAADAGRATSVLLTAGVAGSNGAAELDGSLGSVTMDSRSKEFVLAMKNRALAEAAVRTISGVAAVSIGFSRPKRLPYSATDDETQSRASITLQLVPGAASFRRIAASAIEVASASLAIPPEYVTVVNTSTAEIFRLQPDGRDEIGTTDFLIEQRRRSEELTQQAQSMLTAMYPGQAQVLVTVDLDPNWSITRQKIVPEAPLVKTDELTKSETPTPSRGNNGDPSTSAAVLGGVTGGDAGAAAAAKDETRKRTFETIIGESQSGMRASDIRRLSVALVVDEAHKSKETSIVALVKRAVGWNDTRDGEGFALHFEKIQPMPEMPAEAGPSLVDLAMPWLPTVAQIGSVALVLMFLRSLLRRASATAAAEAAKPEAPETAEETTRRMRREIERAIAEDPSSITRLLETWLAEQKT